MRLTFLLRTLSLIGGEKGSRQQVESAAIFPDFSPTHPPVKNRKGPDDAKGPP